MSLRCLVGLHRDAVEVTWKEADENTVYGVTCERCGRPRCTLGGARPLPPRPKGAPLPLPIVLWKMWLERKLGRPVAGPHIWFS